MVPEDPHHSAGLLGLLDAVGCSLDPVQKFLVLLDERWTLGRTTRPQHVLASCYSEIHTLGDGAQHRELVGRRIVVGDPGLRTWWASASASRFDALRGLQRLATVQIHHRQFSGLGEGAGFGGRLRIRNFGRRVGHDLERRIVLVHWRLGQLAPAPAQPEQLSEKGAGCPLLFF